MATSSNSRVIPCVLILGHSFVHRLQSDLKARFDERTAIDFDLQGTADIYMHGVGGRKVPKLKKVDLGLIAKISPEIVILEIGTNDLVNTPPEVVGSYIEDMVRHLISHYSIPAVVLCHVTPCMTGQSPKFNEKATLLNQYTRVVLEPIQQAICWKHRGFSNPSITPFLLDGVHFNPMGQYILYRSYRGAVKHALNVLKQEKQG